MKRTKAIALFLGLIFLLAIPVYAAPTPVNQLHEAMFPVGSEQVVDYASHLNVRRGPNTDYAAFGTIARGTAVTVLEYRDKWVRVNTIHGEGWIFAGFLSREAAAAAPLAAVAAPAPAPLGPGERTPFELLNAGMFPVGSQATVDFAPNVNIRRGAGNSHAAFTTVARGDVVTVLEYSGGWVRLTTPQGEGWIFAGFLSNAAVLAVR